MPTASLKVLIYEKAGIKMPPMYTVVTILLHSWKDRTIALEHWLRSMQDVEVSLEVAPRGGFEVLSLLIILAALGTLVKPKEPKSERNLDNG